MTLLEFVVGVFVPCLGIAVVYLALLGRERLLMRLKIEYYRALKAGADKERKSAVTGTNVTTRLRDMERDAIKILERERLIRWIESKPPTPAPTSPPPAAGAAP